MNVVVSEERRWMSREKAVCWQERRKRKRKERRRGER
jgi:hypothetical protein